MKGFARRVRDLDRAAFRAVFGLKWTPLTAVLRFFTVVGTSGFLCFALSFSAFVLKVLELEKLLLPWADVAVYWTVAVC